MPTNIKLISLTPDSKNFFISKLKDALIEKFGSNIPENYGTDKPWSLINLIENNTIDTYQLLYVDNKIWTGSGGMVREFKGEKVYQAGFRAFSLASYKNQGLGVKTYTHQYSTKYQIERAIINECTSVIFSFNDYNKRLFEITYNYTLPKYFPKEKLIKIDELTEFNGTPQFLIIYKL